MSTNSNISYTSTRGTAPVVGFKKAIISGLAEDGGLYLPEKWPTLSQSELRGFQGRPYYEIAAHVIGKFTSGELGQDVLLDMTSKAYSNFNHDAVAPLSQLTAREWLLELSHGPTLAFKDVAMQLLGQMLDYFLEESNQRMTIIGATSGDTGGAAMSAFGGKRNIDVFFLYPDQKISGFQKMQMTTLPYDNTNAIAIEGSFDDCQEIVKTLLGDQEFRERASLGTVNSINWGRIVAQVVYFVTSCVGLGLPQNGVSFSVPTGNFGDIYAGYVAKKMGAPINRLAIACNENDILARLCRSGVYQKGSVLETITPSMDIQVASNFERLLSDLADRNGERVRQLMSQFTKSGSLKLNQSEKEQLDADFDAVSVSQSDTLSTIREVWEKNHMMIDPHTAVGVRAARAILLTESPMVILSTAHPAKFEETMRAALNCMPQIPSWTHLGHMTEEKLTILPNEVGAVSSHISKLLMI